MTAEQQLSRLARRSSAGIIGAAVSAVSSVAVVALVTNFYSKDVAGVFFAATAAFLIVAAVTLAGTDTGLVKLLPQYLAHGRTSDIPATFLISVVPVAALSTAAGVAGFLLAPSAAGVLVGDAHSDLMADFLRCLSVFVPLAAINDALLAATRGLGTMRPTVFVEHIGRHLAQPLAVVAAYVAGAGGVAIALSWAAPYVLAVAVGAWWVAILTHRRLRVGATRTAQPVRVVAGEFWRFTSPRALARITQAALKRADILLVAALASPAEAALYTAATRFVSVGQLVVLSLQQVLAPQLSLLFARGDRAGATAIFKASTAWILILTWPMYLTFAVFASSLLDLFGSGYDAASSVVVILCLTMLLATACGPVDSVLLMAGRSWLSLVNNTSALVVNLVLNWLLIPEYGLNGAAIAWAVALGVRNLLPLVQVGRSLRMWPGGRGAFVVGAAAVVFFGGAPALAQLVLDSVWAGAATAAVGAIAFLFLLWVTRAHLALGAFRGVVQRGKSAAQRPQAGAVEQVPS